MIEGGDATGRKSASPSLPFSATSGYDGLVGVRHANELSKVPPSKGICERQQWPVTVEE